MHLSGRGFQEKEDGGPEGKNDRAVPLKNEQDGTDRLTEKS
jgi:hypothetical protein